MRIFSRETYVCLRLISDNSLDLKFIGEFLCVKCDLSSKDSASSPSVFPSYAQEEIFFSSVLS